MTTLEANDAATKLVALENAAAALVGLDSSFGRARIHVKADWWLAKGWPITEVPGSRSGSQIHVERTQGPITWVAVFQPDEIPAERFECAVCRRA